MNTQRLLQLAGGGLLVGGLVAVVVVWSWTRTPYGPMDVGAALLLHTMPSGPLLMTPERRATTNAWAARLMGDPPDGIEIRDLEFPAAVGPQPARIYIPEGGQAPMGVVVWIHGGGFWMGDELDKWDANCGNLAKDAGAIVASVGYRLAPEHPFPAAVEDSWAGLQWAHSQAASWGGDPERMAVMGGSAGGNLAAVMAQRARDEGGPALALQILTVPTLNAGGKPTESMRLFSQGYGLDGIEPMRDAYFAQPGDRAHPWASPLLASDVSWLAPAVIHTAQFDPLRDEGEQYAEKLRAAGVPVELRRFEGALHGFMGSSATQAESGRLVADAVRRAFSR